jgi:hypothetical protein
MGEPLHASECYSEPYNGQECWESRPREPVGQEKPPGVFRAIEVPCRKQKAWLVGFRAQQDIARAVIAERLRQLDERKESRK